MKSVGQPELPSALVTAIREQSAVLFLGAGASFGAKHDRNLKIPSAQVLAEALSNRFLGGKLKDKSLAHIAEMCISESDLLSVQAHVRDIFLPFGPASHHKIIPRFFWHAIVTTNYDLVLEKAYRSERNAKQTLTTFVKDGQQFDKTLKATTNGVPFLKLHGSIDKIDDNDIPLILAKEQYSKYRSNRKRLFNLFENYGYEYTIIFCGYSLDDAHIQEILFDLSDHGISRPRYYIVTPGLDVVEERYWASRRITCIKATFEQFLMALEGSIPEFGRSIRVGIGGGTESVRKFYKVSSPVESADLKQFLGVDAEHVRPGMATSGENIRKFYKGAISGWGPIEAGLDIYRTVTDNIILDAILENDEKRQSIVDLHVIKGPAGHGKSTTLRRVAWEAAKSYEKLSIFVKEEGSIRIEALRELSDLVQDRMFLFVDRAALRADEISELIHCFSAAKIPLTIVTAERDNEWNVRCGILDEFVAQEFPLRHLSGGEIRELLEKLEENGALGRLSEFSYDQRFKEFNERAGRQLLVALHEATLGKPFEEIIKDEYDRVVPKEAQRLYLDVCTLNRLGAPVRAGLIARISGIRFEDFQDSFILPLEHVVKSHLDHYVGDRMYSARHQHIADLVFQQVLTEPEERFEQIMRVLDGINIDYSSDNEAFRTLVRGRGIADIFLSQELARSFYARAESLIGEDSYFLQQKGIFEMIHPGGSLSKAEESLTAASRLAPHDKSIQHTLGNLKRQQALEATSPLLREKYRRDAYALLSPLAGKDARTPHAFHTQILVRLDELKELLSEDAPRGLETNAETQVVELVRKTESAIREAKQRFADEERILTAEASLRELLKQHAKAYEALQKAFDRNPRSEYVAIRLSDLFVDNDNIQKAKDVLTKCIRENPSSKQANFALARLYMRHGTSEEKAQICQLLRRSFTDGDSNFDAQYWYARELFIAGELEQSAVLFERLSHAPVSPATRNRVRGVLHDDKGETKRYRGRVAKKEEAYLFVEVEGFPRDIFCHVSKVQDDVWTELRIASVVDLEIGFSLKGPVASRIIHT